MKWKIILVLFSMLMLSGMKHGTIDSRLFGSSSTDFLLNGSGVRLLAR